MESHFWGGPSILLPMLGPKQAGGPGTTNPFVDTIPIKIYWKFGNDEIIHLPTNYDFFISLPYSYISVKYRRVLSRLGSLLSLKIIPQKMIIIRLFYQNILSIFKYCFEKLLSIPGQPLKVVPNICLTLYIEHIWAGLEQTKSRPEQTKRIDQYQSRSD